MLSDFIDSYCGLHLMGHVVVHWGSKLDNSRYERRLADTKISIQQDIKNGQNPIQAIIQYPSCSAASVIEIQLTITQNYGIYNNNNGQCAEERLRFR